ncbi:MAG: DUF302 domain-containing protein [Pseudomonadota bacterium]
MNRRLVPLVAACAVLAGAAAAQTPGANFIVKTTAKSPEAVVSDLKSRVLQNKWLYLAEFKVKNDEVTVVKMCVPAAGKDIWSAGMHVSALLPCGHFGVYREDGTTKVSLLDPRFMNVLNPHPGLKKAGDDLHPLLTGLLDEVTK